MSSQNLITKIWSTLDDMGVKGKIPLGEDAVITGSLLWKVLTDGKFTPQDVDIFCTRSAVPRLRQFFVDNGYLAAWVQEHFYTERSTIVEEWTVPGSRLFPDQEDGKRCLIECSTNNGLGEFPEGFKAGFRKSKQNTPEVSVQLIIADSKDIKKASELIRNQFDFPTLENWFDGQDLTVSYPENVSERTSKFRILMYSGLPNSVWQEREYERFKKYKSYGLNVAAPEWMLKKLNKENTTPLAVLQAKMQSLQEKIDKLEKENNRLTEHLVKFPQWNVTAVTLLGSEKHVALRVKLSDLSEFKETLMTCMAKGTDCDLRRTALNLSVEMSLLLDKIRKVENSIPV